jgi:DeoR family fructose operon transcriptional repressor
MTTTDNFIGGELCLVALLPLQRQKMLLDAIQRSGIVSYKELGLLVDVSDSTLRRDLRELKQKGLIELERGAAISLQQGNDFELQPVLKNDFSLEKRAIGQAAAELINEEEIIILDSGTTVLELAKAINPKLHVTCVTNAVLIAIELCKKPNVDVILIGGSMNHAGKALIGPMAIQNLREIHAQKVFLGAAGISEEMGISNYNLSLIQIRQAMIEISEEAIVLADHSKFGRKALSSVACLDDIQRVVTSSGISEDDLQMLSRYDIEVIRS